MAFQRYRCVPISQGANREDLRNERCSFVRVSISGFSVGEPSAPERTAFDLATIPSTRGRFAPQSDVPLRSVLTIHLGHQAADCGRRSHANRQPLKGLTEEPLSFTIR